MLSWDLQVPEDDNFKYIRGMDTINDGQIIVDGNDISKLNLKELTFYRRYDVGFVFQFYNLIPQLTALENVEIASEICKSSLDPLEVLNK